MNTKVDGINTFLQDTLVINDIEYKRSDLDKIINASGKTVKPHPFNPNMKSLDFDDMVTINGIECKNAIIEIEDGKILDVIMYPYFIMPWIAACSVSCKPDIYNTPVGQMADCVFDPDHKISFGPENIMLYVWK